MGTFGLNFLSQDNIILINLTCDRYFMDMSVSREIMKHTNAKTVLDIEQFN